MTPGNWIKWMKKEEWKEVATQVQTHTVVTQEKRKHGRHTRKISSVDDDHQDDVVRK
jgi:hypothetical protein